MICQRCDVGWALIRNNDQLSLCTKYMIQIAMQTITIIVNGESVKSVASNHHRNTPRTIIVREREREREREIKREKEREERVI